MKYRSPIFLLSILLGLTAVYADSFSEGLDHFTQRVDSTTAHASQGVDAMSHKTAQKAADLNAGAQASKQQAQAKIDAQKTKFQTSSSTSTVVAQKRAALMAQKDAAKQKALNTRDASKKAIDHTTQGMHDDAQSVRNAWTTVPSTTSAH